MFARRVPTVAPPVSAYSTLLANDALNAQAAAVLFGAFAVVALLLALAGIYAVIAYAAEQRTQGFGVRRAIGARDTDLMRDVLGRSYPRYARRALRRSKRCATNKGLRTLR